MTQFQWNATSGSWDNAANWLDVTNGGTIAIVPPGAADTATVVTSNASLAAMVSGPGSAATLTVEQSVNLTGSLAIGALMVGLADGTFGALDLGPGATVSAQSASILGAGLLTVVGAGASLIDTGTLTIGSTPIPTSYLSPDAQIENQARVQAASVVLVGGFPDIEVDRTATFEVGTVGTSTTGALTVDVGATLAGAGSLNRSTVIDNGLVAASGGTLNVGKVSGSGALRIDAGAELDFQFSGTVDNPVAFNGNDASLNLRGAVLNGTISGFAPGDTILPFIAADHASWSPTSGHLLIANTFRGSGSEGTPLPPSVTLLLSGDYSGQSFYVVPFNPSIVDPLGSPAVELGAPVGAAAPLGTARGDTFQWNAGSGAWGNAASWNDTTEGVGSAAVAPGDLDTVEITGNGGTAPALITGPGNSRNLGITNAVALAGPYDTGAVTVGNIGGESGALDLIASTTLTAASVQINNGLLLISGGDATLIDNGAMTVGTAPLSTGGNFSTGSVTVDNYATAHLASLSLKGAPLSGASLSVDSTSAVEVGQGVPSGSGLFVYQGATVAGTGLIAGSITLDGAIVAEGGSLDLTASGTIGGSGLIEIDTGSTLAVSAQDVTTGISFAGPNANLSIETYQNGLETILTYIQGGISGLSPGDSIGVPFATSATWSPSGNGGGTITIGLGTSGSYYLGTNNDLSDLSFTVTQPAGFGATVSIACFLSGTRLLTPRGEVPVERLRIGDQVTTTAGDKPVRWIGRREIDVSRCADRERVLPVRIRRDAFGDGTPHRDLFVSPDHALFVDGVLIPAKHLVNAKSAAFVRSRRRLRYYHVELDVHAVLLAEGMPAESLLPGSNRGDFDNHHGTKHLDVGFLAWEANGLAPLIAFGQTLDAVRDRLTARLDTRSSVQRTGIKCALRRHY